MENEKCRFVGMGRYCQILVGVKCDGTDKLCKFGKTEKQFQQERDRAIIVNRKSATATDVNIWGLRAD